MNFMKTLLPLLFVLFIITGCYVEKHNIAPNFNKSDLPLAKNQKIYITLPQDGRYGSTVYFNTGLAVSNTIRNILLEYTSNIYQSDKTIDTDREKINAKKVEAKYFFQPLILHWEDRATNWSGKPDKVSINIRVYDIEKDKELSSINITSNSSWWTFVNSNPEELLYKPISEYLKNLF